MANRRIIKWQIINGLRARVKNEGEVGGGGGGAWRGRLKGWREGRVERNLCKSDCKIPDGNSGALISRLCCSLDSNGIVLYPFWFFFSFSSFSLLLFRNAVLGYSFRLRKKKCVQITVIVLMVNIKEKSSRLRLYLAN